MPKTVELKNELLEELLSKDDINRDEVLGYIVFTLKNEHESNTAMRGQFNKASLLQFFNNLVTATFDIELPDWILGNEVAGKLYYTLVARTLDELRKELINIKLNMLKDGVLSKDPNPSENDDVEFERLGEEEDEFEIEDKAGQA